MSLPSVSLPNDDPESIDNDYVNQMLAKPRPNVCAGSKHWRITSVEASLAADVQTHLEQLQADLLNPAAREAPKSLPQVARDLVGPDAQSEVKACLKKIQQEDKSLEDFHVNNITPDTHTVGDALLSAIICMENDKY